MTLSGLSARVCRGLHTLVPCRVDDDVPGGRPKRGVTARAKFFAAEKNYIDHIRAVLGSLKDPNTDLGTNPHPALSPWRIAWEKASWLHGEALLYVMFRCRPV